ncbi:hypothetical protein [Streptomyces sp. PA03-2a]|uniref:hypothetical protein n=1 Tax=Streptomyces sp. PA03-2a TaxID=3028701 RepID=UPI0029A3304C|nr:hypothetical protein [Streptomyces sp. PA03-2a]MDX2733466.1 hypothetical protein [Streptomyces sp. PA03-2a]
MENRQHMHAYPMVPRRSRPWWKQPVMLLPVGVATVAVAFFIGFAVGKSQGSTDTLPSSPSARTQQPKSPGDQPSGLTFQQKNQILFTFCTSSQMRGPAGDSSTYPTCMGNYYVTDQGMVMPK